MTEKRPGHPIIEYMSVAGHGELLRRSLSPAGHAEGLKPLQQPPQPQAEPQVSTQDNSTSQNNDTK